MFIGVIDREGVIIPDSIIRRADLSRINFSMRMLDRNWVRFSNVEGINLLVVKDHFYFVKGFSIFSTRESMDLWFTPHEFQHEFQAGFIGDSIQISRGALSFDTEIESGDKGFTPTVPQQVA